MHCASISGIYHILLLSSQDTLRRFCAITKEASLPESASARNKAKRAERWDVVSHPRTPAQKHDLEAPVHHMLFYFIKQHNTDHVTKRVFK